MESGRRSARKERSCSGDPEEAVVGVEAAGVAVGFVDADAVGVEVVFCRTQ